MNTAPRVRFAPSPTGSLHVGGARTALYNWLFARRHGGAFVLRIEDTDLERSKRELTDQILDALSWLGLSWDEGPFFQSERGTVYADAAAKLLESGAAYRAFETPEELEAEKKAAEAARKLYRYSGASRSLSKAESDLRAQRGERFVVRLRMPDDVIVVDDVVQGRVEFPPDALDDFVLIRSDGHSLYHFTVCVDDVAMAITHVIRGVDHLPNTPKHVALFRALGVEPPIFAHLGMILGADGKKLSKRHGAAGVEEFREAGFLPEALDNFLALLGWSPGEDRERMSLDEMTALFSLDRLGPSPSRFDHEKLTWMNGLYLQAAPVERLASLLTPFGIPDLGPELLREAVELHRSRAKTLVELARGLTIYGPDPAGHDEDSLRKLSSPAQVEQLRAIADRLAEVDEFTHQRLEETTRAFAEDRGTSLGKVAQPLRLAVTGTSASPPLFDVMALLGRDASIRRIRALADRLEQRAAAG
jgi:glutamyl-tRNA synthetase